MSSETPSGPQPCRVTYSGLVRDELRALILRAAARGRGSEFLAAARLIEERLRIYPQFGEPLRDLVLEPLRLWIGVVPPLVVQYTLDEENRVVMVSVPIRPLSDSELS
jgi:hypothetical protein